MSALPGIVIMLLATIGAVRVLRCVWNASKVAIASLGRCLQTIGNALASVKPSTPWYRDTTKGSDAAESLMEQAQ